MGSEATDVRPSLQVLERAFAVLDVFGRDRAEWTATEIARTVGLPAATTHRILSTLLRQGYVSRDGVTRRFRLGPAALDLGRRARGALDLRRVALPVLERLARETDETALLCVLTDDREASVCLERVESSQPLRLSVEPGRQLPLHAGASQKALLALLPPEDAERALARPLERVCRATVTDAEALRGDLAAIRERGWAISFEETNVGVWGVAMPLVGGHGDVVASVGLAGPSARLSGTEVVDHVRRLHEATAEIARRLGFPEPPEARTEGAWP
jgi:IclR family acetate operon transcriptional repressor